MNIRSLDRAVWPAFALAISAGMLATAHGFERFLFLAPCPLCYNQRQIYWLAMAISAIALFARWRRAPAQVMFTMSVLLGITFAAGAGIASYHALVEWGVLPAPSTCATGGAVNLSSDLWAQLEKRQAVPSCGEAKWRLWGLSMAGWNALVSMALAVTSLISAFRPTRTETDNEHGQDERPESA